MARDPARVNGTKPSPPALKSAAVRVDHDCASASENAAAVAPAAQILSRGEPRFETMSGPGAYEPPDDFVPATIEGVVDDASLPTAPTPGDDELWLIQVPGDVSVKDLHGLRLKLTGEGAGADLAAFKAGGKKYRLVEEDATTVAGMFVLPPTKGGGGGKRGEFGAARPLTRRVTLLRRPKDGQAAGDKDAAKSGGGEGAEKTPKAKKKKRDKGDKEGGKSAKKSKR